MLPFGHGVVKLLWKSNMVGKTVPIETEQLQSSSVPSKYFLDQSLLLLKVVFSVQVVPLHQNVASWPRRGESSRKEQNDRKNGSYKDGAATKNFSLFLILHGSKSLSTESRY